MSLGYMQFWLLKIADLSLVVALGDLVKHKVLLVKWVERDLPLAFLEPIGCGKGYDRKQWEGIKVRGGQLPTPTVLCSKKQSVRKKGPWVDSSLPSQAPLFLSCTCCLCSRLLRASSATLGCSQCNYIHILNGMDMLVSYTPPPPKTPHKNGGKKPPYSV